VKVGELYEVRHKWLLPHDNREFWASCGPVLYLGKDVIERSDGKCIVNHAVLAGGEHRLLDTTFLRLLEPVDEGDP
jgi:hypothetical protein